MSRTQLCITLLLASLLPALPAHADVADKARAAKDATVDAAKTAARSGKSAGKKLGKETARVAVEVYGKTRDVTKDGAGAVADKTRELAGQAKRALDK